MHYENFSLHKRDLRRRHEHHKYVTDSRSFSAVHLEVVDSLVQFLSHRFEADDTLLSLMLPLVKMNTDANINKIHEVFCPDVNRQNLSLEFDDLVDDGSEMCLHDKPLNDLVAVLSRSPHYTTITEVATVGRQAAQRRC